MKAAGVKTMLYCGIEEHNGSEGETFGYYFPQNETTLALVQQIEQRWDENELCEDNNYSFVYDATKEELNIVEKYSQISRRKPHPLAGGVRRDNFRKNFK